MSRFFLAVCALVLFAAVTIRAEDALISIPPHFILPTTTLKPTTSTQQPTQQPTTTTQQPTQNPTQQTPQKPTTTTQQPTQHPTQRPTHRPPHHPSKPTVAPTLIPGTSTTPKPHHHHRRNPFLVLAVNILHQKYPGVAKETLERVAVACNKHWSSSEDLNTCASHYLPYRVHPLRPTTSTTQRPGQQLGLRQVIQQSTGHPHHYQGFPTEHPLHPGFPTVRPPAQTPFTSVPRPHHNPLLNAAVRTLHRNFQDYSRKCLDRAALHCRKDWNVTANLIVCGGQYLDNYKDVCIVQPNAPIVPHHRIPPPQ